MERNEIMTTSQLHHYSKIENMALSIGNVCLHRAPISYVFIKNKFVVYLPHKNSFRQLRGSRSGKELDKTEAKFQQILKSLKDSSKKSVVTTQEFPETLMKAVLHKEESNTDKEDRSPLEEAYKRLEERVTPLKRLTYPRQLERKYKKSLSLLRMFGEKLRILKMPITLGPDKLPCPVDLMVPSPLIDAYRNQDDFSIGIGLDGNLKTVGFYSENDTGNIICLNPDEIVIIKGIHKEFVKDFQNYIRQSPLSAHSNAQDGGYWKNVAVRSNEAGHLMGIVFMHPQKFTKEQLHIEKENLRIYFETIPKSYNLRSLYFQACPLSKCSSEQAPFELLLGESYITEEINGMKYQISPETFFQNNTHAAEVMYESLRKSCKLNESTTVLDVFCGTGAISLKFAPHVKKCIGIDSCVQAINDARNNANLNRQPKVEFLHGNLENLLKAILTEEYFEDLLVVINPSRTELSKTAMKILRECKFLKKIVYISSKPKAAVDNFVVLSKPPGSETYLGKYFIPLLAIPYDLSPQTEHYGLAVMFQRL